MIPPASDEKPTPRSGLLGESEEARLLEILSSGLELLFLLSARALLQSGNEQTFSRIVDTLPSVPPWHRGRAARIAVGLGRDQAASALALFDEADPLLRVSAARMIAELSPESQDGELRDALNRALADKDFSVRSAAFSELASQQDAEQLSTLVALAQVAPTFWTCGLCGTRQQLTDLDCRACPNGTRDDLPVSIRNALPWYTHPTT
jgi:hypothetical protein